MQQLINFVQAEVAGVELGGEVYVATVVVVMRNSDPHLTLPLQVEKPHLQGAVPGVRKAGGVVVLKASAQKPSSSSSVMIITHNRRHHRLRLIAVVVDVGHSYGGG